MKYQLCAHNFKFPFPKSGQGEAKLLNCWGQEQPYTWRWRILGRKTSRNEFHNSKCWGTWSINCVCVILDFHFLNQDTANQSCSTVGDKNGVNSAEPSGLVLQNDDSGRPPGLHMCTHYSHTHNLKLIMITWKQAHLDE